MNIRYHYSAGTVKGPLLTSNPKRSDFDSRDLYEYNKRFFDGQLVTSPFYVVADSLGSEGEKIEGKDFTWKYLKLVNGRWIPCTAQEYETNIRARKVAVSIAKS